MMKSSQRCIDAEAGLSLVEVILYSALTVLVFTVVGGMFYAGFQAQASALGRDAATGSAQVVSTSLQTEIGNASDVTVSDDGTMVQARVANGTAADSQPWKCEAWVLRSNGDVVFKSSSSAITSTDYSTWPVLATGASGPADGGSAFGVSSATVSYSLQFTSGKITVPIAGSVTHNASGDGEPASCW
jgi:hypothetical protein